MGRFSGLKSYAAKEFKFTQDKTVVGFSSKPEYDLVKNGMCAALTARWLNEKLRKPFFFNKSFGGKSDGPEVHQGKNLKTAAAVYDRFVNYKHIDDESAAIEWLLKDSGLYEGDDSDEMSWRNSAGGKSLAKRLAELGTEVVPPGQGVYISLRLTNTHKNNEESGHGVGIYRSNGGSVHFFDPNCGIYDVTKGSEQDFFAELVKIYAGLGFPIDESRKKIKIKIVK